MRHSFFEILNKNRTTRELDRLVKSGALIAFISLEEETRVSRDRCTRNKEQLFEKDEYFRHLISPPDENGRGAHSRKPFNVFLNWRIFFSKLPELSLLAIGGSQSKLAAVLSAMVLWKELWGLSRINLTETHAKILEIIWETYPTQLHELELLSTYNERYTSPEEILDTKRFAGLVDELCDIGCIELVDGKIWRREWMKA